MTKMHEVQVCVIKLIDVENGRVDHYRVLLRHADGTEEISHQGWPTRAEAEAAIEQYAKDVGGDMQRYQ